MGSSGLRRRELLAGRAAGAAAAAFGAGLGAGSAAGAGKPPRLFDVAVVGAGLAGLTAASALRAAGRSVIVLEARD